MQFLLPPEIWIKIFTFIDEKTLGKIALVSRQFRDLGWREESVWHAIALKLSACGTQEQSWYEIVKQRSVIFRHIAYLLRNA